MYAFIKGVSYVQCYIKTPLNLRSNFLTKFLANSKCFTNSIKKFSNFSSCSHERKPYEIFLFKNCVKNSNCTELCKRHFTRYQPNYCLSKNSQRSTNIRSTLYYFTAIVVLVVGLSYAAVPLYRIFCQAYSFAGTTQQDDLNTDKIVSMKKVENRTIKINFNADVSASMQWNFKPIQSVINVAPGETALAFYSARNPTDKIVIGISTYNVLPFDAGQYFNKIQCFCFEEQMLNPNEEVSMPVFFYIDPEFAFDPKMEFVNEITLSYTFFQVKDGMSLPLPGFMNNK